MPKGRARNEWLEREAKWDNDLLLIETRLPTFLKK